ncbi:MAG: helix-turn-helix domain-containing protein [Pseudomonadota bacterium]
MAGRDDFLTVAEAAERLGVSRRRVREAIARGLLPARRDNELAWRVDVAGAPEDLAAALADAPESPAAALLDEIEELEADLLEREASVLALEGLAGRQQALLERTTDALERSRDESMRLSALLDRALTVAEGAGPGLTPAAEGALSLLDRTVTELEQSKAETGRLTALMERTLRATEALEAANREKAEIIRTQEGMVDRLFQLSERTLGLAGGRGPGRRGLVDRLFGR